MKRCKISSSPIFTLHIYEVPLLNDIERGVEVKVWVSTLNISSKSGTFTSGRRLATKKVSN